MSTSKTTSKQLYEDFHNKSKSIVSVPKKNNFTYRHVFQFLVENINFNDTRNVLDIGCGVGSISFYLSKHYPKAQITGIDISSRAIDACIQYKSNQNIKNIHFLRTSIENSKLSNRKFDLIIASEVIEHIADDKVFINKCFSLLRKNGQLIITTPSSNAPLFRLGLLGKFDKEVGHLRRYNLKQLENLLKNSKFQIEKVKLNEGVLRNFLFTNKVGGFILKFVNKFEWINNAVTTTDNMLIHLFGESNIFIFALKQ